MPRGVEVRVLSYNVRSLRDDDAAVARVIRAAEPDVVCVQEAPRFLRWRARCARLAREAGLVVVTGGRSAGANLVLASMRAGEVRTADLLLPRTRGLHQRGVAGAVLALGGARLAVAGTHLGLDAGERARHVRLVLEHARSLGADHLVVAGDVNETPDGPAWAALAAALGDGYARAPWGGAATFPAAAPDRRIDAIFASAEVEVLSCGAYEHPDVAAASDHRPVLAVLRVPARS